MAVWYLVVGVLMLRGGWPTGRGRTLRRKMSATPFYLAIFAWLAILLIAGALLGVGIAMLVLPRRRGAGHPACGHCGYNLTASTANRCPECGKLFIEAGVVTARGPAASRGRRIAGIILCVCGALIVLLVAMAIIA